MLIIDVYNVLHVTGVLPSHLAGVGLEGLQALLAASNWRNQPIRLVCDGPPRELSGLDRSPVGAKVVFAGPGKDADTLIEHLIARSSAPRRLTVVSSDQRLRAAARRRRCKWLSGEAFLRSLADQVARDRPSSPSRPAKPLESLAEDEVVEWMEEFGLEPPAPRAREGTDPPPPAAPAHDKSLREMLREWSGRVSWDDLDMDKWLSTDPKPPPEDDSDPSPSRSSR